MFAEPNDIEARKREVQDFIASNQMSDAVKRLMDFVRDFSNNREHTNDAIMLSNRHNRLEYEVRLEVLSRDDAEVFRNKIVRQMLTFLDEVCNSRLVGV